MRAPALISLPLCAQEVPPAPLSRTQMTMRIVAQSKAFQVATGVAVMGSMAIVLMQHEGEPGWVESVGDKFEYAFTAVFVAEVVAKVQKAGVCNVRKPRFGRAGSMCPRRHRVLCVSVLGPSACEKGAFGLPTADMGLWRPLLLRGQVEPLRLPPDGRVDHPGDPHCRRPVEQRLLRVSAADSPHAPLYPLAQEPQRPQRAPLHRRGLPARPGARHGRPGARSFRIRVYRRPGEAAAGLAARAARAQRLSLTPERATPSAHIRSSSA